MKKAILITAIVALVAGAAGGVWLKTYLDNQAAAAAAEAKPEPSKYDVGPPDPQEMLELVNAERAKVGVAPLVLDENVQRSAQLKAEDMENHGYYGHDIPRLGNMYTQEMRDILYKKLKCKSSGENLHSLLLVMSTSREAIDGWMQSTKGHREAMLDAKYDLVGFGMAKDGQNTLVVQHFCNLK